MERFRHLIVLVPGFGGSVLEDESGPVWGRGLWSSLIALFEPDRLSPSRELRPTGLIRDFTLIPGWTIFHGYQDLVRMIRQTISGVELDDGNPDRVRPEANLILFPYDFRRSIVLAADALDNTIRSRITNWSDEESRSRVIIIAHSLGGLVASYWLGPLGGWPLCRALLTLGTPHRGAPKALDFLVNGIRRPLLYLTAATEMLRAWPSTYELLPQYPVIWDETIGFGIYPSELPPLAGFDRAASKRASQVHRDIESAWSGISSPEKREPEILPFFGTGHPTLEAAYWNGSNLRVVKEKPDWIDAPTHRGDGTVPSVSAIPHELSDRQGTWREIPYRHGSIASAREVAQVLKLYAAGSIAAVRGPDDEREKIPSLGIDMDEFHVAGSSVPLRVDLWPARDQHPTAEVYVEISSVDPVDIPRKPEIMQLDRAGDRWETELHGLSRGTYQLRVEAIGVTPKPRDVAETIAMVEP